MDPAFTAEVQDAVQKVALNTALIHLLCRLAAFARNQTIYDEQPYLMKLQSRAKETGDDEDTARDDTSSAEEEGSSSQASGREGILERSKQHQGNKDRARSKSPWQGSSSSKQAGDDDSGSKPVIAVTGGSGRVGSAVVKALLEDGGFAVRSLDRHDPLAIRKVEGVQYVKIDLLESPEKDILNVLRGAAGIIHCAGTVALYNAPIYIHNQNTYSTIRLLWLARKAGVTAFVHTSSTCVVNNGKQNVNAIPADAPYEENQSTAWGRSHLKTERAVLQASDDPTDPNASFFTVANRLPGIYGLHDRLVASIMIESELSVFPSRTDVRMEMLYIKNAAHAHICAIRALLDKTARVNAAGRALTITQTVEGETSTNLEFWTRARRAMGIKRSFVILPAWMFYMTAMLFEFLYWYFQGIVFKSVFWNFTPAFVDSILHDNTFLGQIETFRAIGYKPRFTSESSFEDMARELREVAKIDKGSDSGPTMRQLLQQMDHDPLADIDWEPRVMPKRPHVLRSLFLTMLGPGVSWHEVIMFYVMQVAAHLFGLTVAYKHGFSVEQTVFACLFAGWHLPGAVMSIGPSSKRWFHLGGNLGMFMLVLIVLDISLSVLIGGLVFPEKEKIAVLWIAVSGAILLLGLFIILFLVPLAHQRAYGVMCFFTVTAAQWLGMVPPIQAGMEWLLPTMAFKFFICHGPRHEPYRYESSS